MKKVIDKFNIKEGLSCLHFEHKGIEFEARVIFEQPPNDYIPILEIWTVAYEENGELYGYEDFVGEVYLDDIFKPTKRWEENSSHTEAKIGYENNLAYKKRVFTEAKKEWVGLSVKERGDMTKEEWIAHKVEQAKVNEPFKVTLDKTNKTVRGQS